MNDLIKILLTSSFTVCIGILAAKIREDIEKHKLAIVALRDFEEFHNEFEKIYSYAKFTKNHEELDLIMEIWTKNQIERNVFKDFKLDLRKYWIYIKRASSEAKNGKHGPASNYLQLANELHNDILRRTKTNPNFQ